MSDDLTPLMRHALAEKAYSEHCAWAADTGLCDVHPYCWQRSLRNHAYREYTKKEHA